MKTVEIIGIIASILIVGSLLFKTTTLKGTLLMRSINIVGSIAFTIYGFLLPAYSTAAANIAAILISIFYIIKEVKDFKRSK